MWKWARKESNGLFLGSFSSQSLSISSNAISISNPSIEPWMTLHISLRLIPEQLLILSRTCMILDAGTSIWFSFNNVFTSSVEISGIALLPPMTCILCISCPVSSEMKSRRAAVPLVPPIVALVHAKWTSVISTPKASRIRRI